MNITRDRAFGASTFHIGLESVSGGLCMAGCRIYTDLAPSLATRSVHSGVVCWSMEGRMWNSPFRDVFSAPFSMVSGAGDSAGGRPVMERLDAPLLVIFQLNDLKNIKIL